MIEPKPLFKERISQLLGSEGEIFFDYCRRPLQSWIRCNTIKMSPEKLAERLSKRWKIEQPFKDNPEIIKVISKADGTKLLPGELGKAREHLLGYYYIQELSSMMPAIALEPSNKDIVLDLCASPGSKTTQIAAYMNNSGLLVANDVRLDRLIILNSNLERCGITNEIVTKEDGGRLCENFSNMNVNFDRILVDAPCSGEGTARVDIKLFRMWNIRMIENFSRQQKRLAASAISILKENGILVYSTCTLTPEENEGVVQFLVDNFDVKVEELNLPVKTRCGISEWQGRKFHDEIKNCCRIYPQDNDSEGFFVAKIRKLKNGTRDKNS
ncbi:MAG: RsmB/NOP family class I SAM-dependent RNA methyltransferase [archaeon]